MPIPDDKSVHHLFEKCKDALRSPIEAHMRKLGVPPDDQAVSDFAFDACRRYLKKAAEDRDDDAPLLQLIRIARDVTIDRYRRGRRMDSPTRKGGGGISLEDARDEVEKKNAVDTSESLGNVIDLRNSLEAMKKDLPREHEAITGWLDDKTSDELQRALQTTRDGVNNLIRRAKKYISNFFNGNTGKE